MGGRDLEARFWREAGRMAGDYMDSLAAWSALTAR